MKIWKRLAVGALSVMMAFSSVACINTPTEDSGEHQHKAAVAVRADLFILYAREYRESGGIHRALVDVVIELFEPV